MHETREPCDDRRVRRTRRKLREALVSLVLERGWEAVSVLDVCEKADVSRSTFYVHFADKEDLLLSGFDDLHATLAAKRGAPQTFAFAEPMLAHAAENQDLARAMVGRQSAFQIQWRFRDVVRSLVDADLASLPAPVRTSTVSFIAGGFCELMVAWLEGPTTTSVEDVAASFRTFATAIVRATR